MTVALVVATAMAGDRPAALLPLQGLRAGEMVTEPVLGRLCGQLAALAVADIVLLAPPGHTSAVQSIALAGTSRVRTGNDCSGEAVTAGTRLWTSRSAPSDGPPWTASGVRHTDVVECATLADELRRVAGIARQVQDAILVCAGDVVGHTEALARLIGEPGTRALVALRTYPARSAVEVSHDLSRRPQTREAIVDPDRLPALRVVDGIIVSAGSSFHRVSTANAIGCGVLLVARDDAAALAGAAEALAAMADKYAAESPFGLGSPVRGPHPAAHGADLTDAIALLLVGLVRDGERVRARDIGPLTCRRVGDEREAAAAAVELHAVDEDAARLKAAVRASDGFFVTFFVSTYSRYIARWAARRGLTPNAVTGMSVGLGFLSALWFADGTRLGLVLGAMLLYGTLVLTAVDGQLARYTRQVSAFGGWLDAMSHRFTEFGVYAGLAAGATGPGAVRVWDLAIAALILQAVRHAIDYSFASARRPTLEPRPPSLPFDEPEDHGPVDNDRGYEDAGNAGSTRPPGRIRGALQRRLPAIRWMRKIIALPMGERFVLIGVTASLSGARMTFLILLVWGAIAAGSTLIGRVVRSRSR